MRRADLQARPTPRLGKLFLPVDPRQQDWPADLPKAVRWLAARWLALARPPDSPSTGILGRRTLPFSPYRIAHRVPHGFCGPALCGAHS